MPERLAVPFSEAAALVGLSRASLYRALARGELKTIRVGARRLIRLAELDSWLRRNEEDTAGEGRP
jgi:excisionase family DNA binding protein